MAKKIIASLFVGLLLINCFFITTVSFANENTISLGNEITKSMDKTGDSMKNVLSGNVIMDAGNNIKNTVNEARNVVMDEANDMKADLKNEANKMDKDDEMKKTENGENYDARRTNAEISRSGIDNNTMMTWMWIALIAATTIIIAAIWYYVTQTND